jgi:hypothetical protein
MGALVYIAGRIIQTGDTQVTIETGTTTTR